MVFLNKVTKRKIKLEKERKVKEENDFLGIKNRLFYPDFKSYLGR